MSLLTWQQGPRHRAAPLFGGKAGVHTQGVDNQAWQQHRWRNRLQSLALLAFMAGFLALLGWLLAGAGGVALLLAGGAFAVLFNPTVSPLWVMRLYGARRLDPVTAPGLSRVMTELARRAGLPAVPALYYLPSSTLNAFAVGTPGQSAVALTDGLLHRLGDRELVGVLAHEISHIQFNDLWVMGLADLFSRATSLLSLFGQFLLLLNLPLVLLGVATVSWWAVLLLIFAPHLSALAQLALSRTREYDADLNAAHLTGDPDGLASALVKIEHLQGGWLERILLPGRGIPEPSLLRTHPLTSDRVERLDALNPARPPLLRDLPPGGSLYDRPTQRRVTRGPRWHLSGLWH
jgi:heat shock protein HtpX